jgi:hypothetical protein
MATSSPVSTRRVVFPPSLPPWEFSPPFPARKAMMLLLLLLQLYRLLLLRCRWTGSQVWGSTAAPATALRACIRTRAAMGAAVSSLAREVGWPGVALQSWRML